MKVFSLISMKPENDFPYFCTYFDKSQGLSMTFRKICSLSLPLRTLYAQQTAMRSCSYSHIKRSFYFQMLQSETQQKIPKA